jgi:hypothetical protein
MRRRYGDAGHLSYTKLVDLTPRSLGFGADVLAAVPNVYEITDLLGSQGP